MDRASRVMRNRGQTVCGDIRENPMVYGFAQPQRIMREEYVDLYAKIGAYTPAGRVNYAEQEEKELNGILCFFTRTEKFDLFIPTF